MLCPLFNEQSCRILNANRGAMASPMLAFDLLSKHLPNRMNEISLAAKSKWKSWAFSSTINLTTEVTTDDKRILLSHVQRALLPSELRDFGKRFQTPKKKKNTRHLHIFGRAHKNREGRTHVEKNRIDFDKRETVLLCKIKQSPSHRTCDMSRTCNHKSQRDDDRLALHVLPPCGDNQRVGSLREGCHQER